MSLRRKPDGLRCVICGSSVGVQRNHTGGQNHVAWFWMPFCEKHHNQFHELCRIADIKLEYTSDPYERLLRGLKANQVCEFMMLEALQELNAQRYERPDSINPQIGDGSHV
jgi:hypothetical protein